MTIHLEDFLMGILNNQFLEGPMKPSLEELLREFPEKALKQVSQGSPCSYAKTKIIHLKNPCRNLRRNFLLNPWKIPLGLFVELYKSMRVQDFSRECSVYFTMRKSSRSSYRHSS